MTINVDHMADRYSGMVLENDIITSNLSRTRPNSSRTEYTEDMGIIEAVETRARQMVVQEFRKNYLYHRLVSGGSVVNVYDVLEIPMHIGFATSGKWMGRDDLLPNAPKRKGAMAYWSNRYLAVPYGWNQFDIWENKGNADALWDRMEFIAMEAAVAMWRQLSSALITGIGGVQPDGISSVIEKAAVGSQTAVVGGVDKSAKQWFNNRYVNLNSNFGTIGANTTIPAGLLAILELINQCTIGTSVPSDLVTTKNVFSNARRAMLEISTPFHSITEKISANMSLGSFIFDGQVISWDPGTPSNTMYALHIEDRFDKERLNSDDPTVRDLDMEKVSTDKFLDLSGNTAIIRNPNVDMITLDARSPYRGLNVTQWMATSMNIGWKRLADQGVLGATSTELETW